MASQYSSARVSDAFVPKYYYGDFGCKNEGGNIHFLSIFPQYLMLIFEIFFLFKWEKPEFFRASIHLTYHHQYQCTFLMVSLYKGNFLAHSLEYGDIERAQSTFFCTFQMTTASNIEHIKLVVVLYICIVFTAVYNSGSKQHIV